VPVADVTGEIINTAAALRALTRLKTPDAMIVASVAVAGCDAVIVGDRRCEVVNGLRNV
jgi:predicted nucleic acid-binding protein